MSGKFLERNKKKSLLAALLLFLRQRKILVLLLLLLLGASTVFLSPTGWLAKWGLGGGGAGGKGSYSDLLAAFKAAKNGTAGGGGGGWRALFGHGGTAGGGAGGIGIAGGAVGGGSLDFVKGNKADLEHGVGAAAGGGTQSVAAIVDPNDPKHKSDNAVAIAEEDLGGQGEGLAKSAFAGGFMNGLVGGGSGGNSSYVGNGNLSGGAFANKGFFSGKGGAAGTSNGMAKAGLAGLSSVSTPGSVRGSSAKGTLSHMSSAASAKATKGVAGAGGIGSNIAYTQLASGGARATLGTQYCQPPDCPVEYAATTTGQIYDGNDITTAGSLTSSDPAANAAGLITGAVNVPPDMTGGGGGDGGTGPGDTLTNAENMKTCSDQTMACAQSKIAPMKQEGKDETQLRDWYGQMGGACGDPCNCGPCHDLKNKINNLCSGDLATQIALADATTGACGPLPDFCAALGFTSSDPLSVAGATAPDLCKTDVMKCGCTNFICDVGCFLGS